MAISFKNVGIRTDSINENPLNRNRSVIPVGIKTPLQFSDGDGQEIFNMNITLKDQIRDNLRNLILTNHGERVIQYNFGGNLRPLLAEYYNKETFDSEAMIRINTAINKFMPFIVPIDFESSEQYSYSNKLSNV
jgi:phage baseplate assembly protein W